MFGIALGDFVGDLAGLFNLGILFSPDGVTWVPVEMSEEMRGATVGNIAASDDRFLILGFRGACLPHAECYMPDDAGPASWTSHDGGHWEFHPLIAIDGTVTAVASDGQGFLAIGSRSEATIDEPAVWTSPDGISWTEGNAPDVAQLVALAGGANGFYAIGSNTDAIYVHETFSAWTSADGTTWEKAGEFPDQVCCSVYALATGGDSVVAVGAGDCGDSLIGAAWTMNDRSKAWDRVPHGENLDEAFLSEVVKDGEAFIAAGTVGQEFESSRVATWTSGREAWERTTLSDDAGSWGVKGVASNDDGVVVVAWMGSDPMANAESRVTTWFLPHGETAVPDALGDFPAVDGCDVTRSGTGWRTIDLESNFDTGGDFTWRSRTDGGVPVRIGTLSHTPAEVRLIGNPSDIERIEVRSRDTDTHAGVVTFLVQWLLDDAWFDQMWSVEDGTSDRVADENVAGLSVSYERLDSGDWEYLFVGVPATDDPAP